MNFLGFPMVFYTVLYSFAMFSYGFRTFSKILIQYIFIRQYTKNRALHHGAKFVRKLRDQYIYNSLPSRYFLSFIPSAEALKYALRFYFVLLINVLKNIFEYFIDALNFMRSLPFQSISYHKCCFVQ